MIDPTNPSKYPLPSPHGRKSILLAHTHTMASSLRLGLPKKPMAPPPPLPLDKTKKKKKKRRDVGLTEEDLLLGLMDEMGAAIKGGVSGVLGQGWSIELDY